ncbi:ABC transporter ATP-binding protein/permease [Patescibacteria group bacterium]|nr:ABC transporter ATP-binding protein/permease [Patescibacteria group bacterium]
MAQSKDIQEIPQNPIAFIGSVSRPHILLGVAAFSVAIAAQLFSSFSPYIIKMLINAALSAADTAAQMREVSFWSALYVASMAGMFLLWRLSGFIGLEFISRSQKTAYERLYAYVSLHSHTYFSNRFAGSLSNKISNASDGVDKMLENMLWSYVPGIISLVTSVILFGLVDVLFGAIYTALIVMVIIVNIFLVRYRRPYVVASAEASSRFRGVSVDMLSNISAMRQYARRSYEMDLIGESVKEKYRTNVRQWRISEWSLALNNALIVSALGLIVYLAIVGFNRGSTSVGDIVMIITLVFQTSGTLVFIGSTMNGAVRVYGDMQEGLEDVLAPHEIVDTPDTQALTIGAGEIVFKDVSFAYDSMNVFSDLNLRIAPGERVGLVGTSGAGKTTLVSLLLRQHDLNGGSISIDGQDIASVTQDSLREVVGVVPQEPALFHRSLRDNIAYGKIDATDEEIVRAATMAHATEFIQTLPTQYETLVGERGVKLSGGQRQRIAIARAILKNAPILVLDEATSALDSASEVLIQEALHTLMEGKTVIAIAHRLSTLREMDRIVVLDKGSIAESGTHDELVKKGGVYAGLWAHQIGGFIQE